MTVAELLKQYCFAESLLGGLSFSVNCVVLEINIQPGMFIAPDAPSIDTLTIAFENCLFFEVKRLDVAELGDDQLFQIHDGARTITAAVEDRHMIPLPWDKKYGSAINGLIIETVDLVLKIICCNISVR